ncbi:AMP-binding protein [Persicirhabdus sediminis]|uniref:AMP-binding protein n=1 Tax=Persicirhabdus sediminis TaxID=454144 RepID=A0A8J7MC90_9BACT|nr:AMP-binding protein [Persicirhabdus sediminis]MBK1790371.1 AMP-binding protein [Persicirhabdus sediminis]
MSQAIEFFGLENLSQKGALIIPGRLDFHEVLQLENKLADRQITWLCEENISLEFTEQAFLEAEQRNVLAFSLDDDPQLVGKKLKESLANNGVIIFLAGQARTHRGDISPVPASHLQFLCKLGLPIHALSCHMVEENALCTDILRNLPKAIISLSVEIPAKQASPASWREALVLGDERNYSSRSFLEGSLTLNLLAGLKKHGSTSSITDGTDDSTLSYDKILGAAIALSQIIKQETKKKRVAIILPPGKGGLVANLAVLFANKIPVNINFTASNRAIHSSIRQAGVDKYITADPFIRKMPHYPWPPNRDIIYIERELPVLKKKIIRWVILSKILPVPVLAKMLGLGEDRNNDEAVLLFTSGSSGEPKGVPLSHRNVLANICQFGSRVNMSNEHTLLGCLPLFHSFGSTVTLWYPCIEGINLVTYPSPLETKRLADLIEAHQISLLINTPTFLRGYMRRVDPEKLKSLKLIATGAEKLPRSLAEKFAEKFGIMPMEGYGLTETSPATNLNIPDMLVDGTGCDIPSNKAGSVGKLLPGIAVKLTNPANDKATPISEQGVIWLKGSNIFQGYLKDAAKTDEVIKDGWLNTGDIGRVDDDGFLYIEGRISRFSKIAGEMVPHETVEAAINQIYELDQETERKIAVVGVPDEQKGEAIVLLSTLCGDTYHQECIDLRYKLMDMGIPSLWCPRNFIPVEEIPVLASGKLDIKGCEQLAQELS